MICASMHCQPLVKVQELRYDGKELYQTSLLNANTTAWNSSETIEFDSVS